MELFNPESGLIIWMLIVFCALLFILAKFAFPIITKSIAAREKRIADAVKWADEADERLAKIKEERNAILSQAREEQNAILKEVQNLKEKMIADAKVQARQEYDKIVESAKSSIEAEKQQALKEVRQQVALLSIEIAEKVVRKNLQSDSAQIDLVNKILDDVNVLKN